VLTSVGDARGSPAGGLAHRVECSRGGQKL
jgi:hypothetical protein